jgi:hypothetical protein
MHTGNGHVAWESPQRYIVCVSAAPGADGDASGGYGLVALRALEGAERGQSE